MTTDIDVDIMPTILRLTKQLLITADPRELTNTYIGDITIPGYITSLGMAHPHEVETDKKILYDKYYRRFERLLSNIKTTKCIFIICTRFTILSPEDIEIINLLVHQNTDNKCLIISGVVQTNILDNERIYVEVLPYNRSDFYNYDYTVFRPYFESKIVDILENIIKPTTASRSTGSPQ